VWRGFHGEVVERRVEVVQELARRDHNLHTYCTLCFTCMITSGCNQGQQVKRSNQKRGANVDAVGKQQQKRAEQAMLLV